MSISENPSLYTLWENIPKIGKLPYGAMRDFNEREALMKERLYWKKGFIERKALLKVRLFFERKALLKEGLYWKKGFFERKDLLK